MNLRQVREVAERCLRDDAFRHAGDLELLRDYAIATIDPSPDAAITAEWLREVWGFEKTEWSKKTYENDHGIIARLMVKIDDDCWYYEDDNFEWPNKLTTRQQFADLARFLGIPRKQPKPDPEGCTCLSSPNMLNAPCIYCDKQRKDGVK